MLDRILEHFQAEKDSEDLRSFPGIEEAHLRTAKEVSKEAVRFLDRVLRLLRKKRVGVMLVSHKISDFDPAMRSSMNISTIFRTKYEGDLDNISRTMGSDFSRLVSSTPVGHAVFHAADLGSLLHSKIGMQYIELRHRQPKEFSTGCGYIAAVRVPS